MKHIGLQQIDYVVYATFAAATVVASVYLASPGVGRLARTLVTGAWLYLTNTRG